MNEQQSHHHDPEDRLVDLLIEQATHGLSDSQRHELEQLISPFDNATEIERFETVAAAVDLTHFAIDPESNLTMEPIPSEVRDRLLMTAGQFFAGEMPTSSSPTNSAIPIDGLEPTVKRTADRHPEANSTSPAFRMREVVVWAALAASLLLLVSGWNPLAPPTTTTLVASMSEQYDEFLANKPSDLIELDWQPVHDPDAGGKVLWSDSAQKGFMVFTGMDVNDPRLEQYQLWIFDNDYEQATPTDGGVFDISPANQTADGKIIVPIDASVPVERAVQFAVTVETPGGVYVSKREKIPVLATLASAD